MKARKSILSIFVALFLVMTTGFCLTTAFATDDAAPTVNVTLTEAAAVRNEQPYGIMFKANVNASELTEYYGEDVIFGMLICPADFVTESKPLAIGVENGLVEYNPAVDGENAPADSYRNVTAIPTDGVYCCNLINIKTENLSRPYMARAYVGIKNGESYEYIYSNTFARSIYTVATYALANNDLLADTDETKLDESAIEYLTEVIDTVQSVYTELTVDVSNKVFDGENDFTVSATVSNGTRTLESCVKLYADNITQTDVDSYNANVLGEFTANAVVGNLEAVVEGFNCKTINYAVKEAFNEYAYGGSSKAVLTEVDGEVGGVSGATHWNSIGNSTPVLGVVEEIKSQAKDDVYLSFDYYVDYNETDNAEQTYPQNGRLLFFEFYDSSISGTDKNAECYLYNVSAPYTFTKDDTGLGACAEGNIISYRLYDEFGLASAQKGVGHIYNKWVKIEIQFHKDFSVEEITRIDFGILRSFDDGVYFKNVKLSTEVTKQLEQINVFTSASEVSNVYAMDSTLTNITYLSTFEGVDNVLKVEPAIDELTGNYVTTGNCKFKIDSKFDNVTKNGCWVYFDVYVPFVSGKSPFALCASTESSNLIYNGISNTTEKWAFYDLNGNAYDSTTKTIWSQSLASPLLNNWVRVEVYFDTFISGSIYRYIGSYRNDGAVCYFANIRLSNMPLDFSIFAE